jgi:hypothetical protein
MQCFTTQGSFRRRRKSVGTRSSQDTACIKAKGRSWLEDRGTAKINSMFPQAKPGKTACAKPLNLFEELADPAIDQKGYREWQHPFLAGSEEYGYHPSNSASLSQETKGSSFISPPGEIRSVYTRGSLKMRKKSPSKSSPPLKVVVVPLAVDQTRAPSIPLLSHKHVASCVSSIYPYCASVARCLSV